MVPERIHGDPVIKGPFAAALVLFRFAAAFAWVTRKVSSFWCPVFCASVLGGGKVCGPFAAAFRRDFHQLSGTHIGNEQPE